MVDVMKQVPEDEVHKTARRAGVLLGLVSIGAQYSVTHHIVSSIITGIAACGLVFLATRWSLNRR